MKKSLLALMMVASGITSVHATEVLDGNLTGNLTITSNYEFRGISLSQNGPAIQGGIDYNHSSGLYIGNWNSSFRSLPNLNNDDIDANSGVQMNVYAGWKGEYKGVRGDVGYITYNFPHATNAGETNVIQYNTGEAYVSLGYAPITIKYSQTMTNYFGTNNSSGTHYTQADFKQSLEPLTPDL